MNEYEITLWIVAYIEALRAGLKYPPATVIRYPQGSEPETVEKVREYMKKYEGSKDGQFIDPPYDCKVEYSDPCEANDKFAERAAELAVASFRRGMKGGE